MGRDYQRIKNNKYILPRNLYRHTLYVIRDYDRIRLEYEDMLQLPAVRSDGQPKGTDKSDPTALTAARAEKYHDIISAVDKAKKKYPKSTEKAYGRTLSMRHLFRLLLREALTAFINQSLCIWLQNTCALPNKKNKVRTHGKKIRVIMIL